MRKPHYSAEKRERERAKQAKREAKQQRKQAKAAEHPTAPDDVAQAPCDGPGHERD